MLLSALDDITLPHEQQQHLKRQLSDDSNNTSDSKKAKTNSDNTSSSHSASSSNNSGFTQFTYPSRHNPFRNRKPNTSRPPSKHVDEFQKQAATAAPTTPSNNSKPEPPKKVSSSSSTAVSSLAHEQNTTDKLSDNSKRFRENDKERERERDRDRERARDRERDRDRERERDYRQFDSSSSTDNAWGSSALSPEVRSRDKSNDSFSLNYNNSHWDTTIHRTGKTTLPKKVI